MEWDTVESFVEVDVEVISGGVLVGEGLEGVDMIVRAMVWSSSIFCRVK